MTYRVLVTGSRHWTDEAKVWAILWQSTDGHPVGDVVIVHGDCPTGVDRFARHWAEINRFAQEPHPADWDRYGSQAGPRRNAEMIRAGADLCLAFPQPGSSGTWDTVNKARAAGIPVMVCAGSATTIAERNYL